MMSALPQRCFRSAFTLIELLTVVAIMLVVLGLAVPAFNSLNKAADVNQTAEEVAGAIRVARNYAMVNNTYTWLGFYEEDPTQSAGTAGIGRLVLSIVASQDGSSIYTTVVSPATPIPPSRLVQVAKLLKLDDVHLKTAIANDAIFPHGSGTGDSFMERPTVTGNTAKIGDTSPNASLTPFQYPVGNPAPTAQYTFSKVIEFNPRGEARINNSNYTRKPEVEIGLQTARGNSVDTNNANVVAIQLTGIAGNVKVYRR